MALLMHQPIHNSHSFAKNCTLLLSLLFCVAGGLGMGYFWANIATQDNPMTYCEIVANISRNPSTDRNSTTYIKTNNDFERYAPTKHLHEEKFFIVYGEKNIDDANWSSNGSPCILHLKPFLGVLGIFSVVGFIITGVCIGVIIGITRFIIRLI